MRQVHRRGWTSWKRPARVPGGAAGLAVLAGPLAAAGVLLALGSPPLVEAGERAVVPLPPASEDQPTAEVSADGRFVLGATIRRFERFDAPRGAGHPDFQQYATGHRLGLVADRLDPGASVPVLASAAGVVARTGRPAATAAVLSSGSFARWFGAGENGTPAEVRFRPAPDERGGFIGEVSPGLPGYGTIECRGVVTYRRGTGQWMSLEATDDAWLFVGDRLAIDLGGTHPRLEGRVDLDALADRCGFRDGQRLSVALFAACRRVGGGVSGGSGHGLAWRTSVAVEGAGAGTGGAGGRGLARSAGSLQVDAREGGRAGTGSE